MFLNPSCLLYTSIIPGEKGNFRNDVFLERAIVGERLRLAMGLPYRSAAEHSPISDGKMCIRDSFITVTLVIESILAKIQQK